MALSARTKRYLSYLLGGWGRVTNFSAKIDSAGALNAATIRALNTSIKNRKAATLLATAVATDASMGAYTQNRLAKAMGSRAAAALIEVDLADE